MLPEVSLVTCKSLMIIRFINKYGELKKQIWNSENENRRIDFPTWHQIREVFSHGDCYSDDLTTILNGLNYGTKDKVGLQHYCEKCRHCIENN